jgi:hypothetical protein
MAKHKVTVTLDPGVLADLDKAAHSAGMNRSEFVERVLRRDRYRRLLAEATPPAKVPDAEQQLLRGLLDWQRDPGSGPSQQAA